MGAVAGLGETARLQPRVQLGIIGKVQPQREQPLAHVADLVLDSGFGP